MPDKRKAPARDISRYIRLRGAAEHNLKNIDLDIPRNQLVVMTGLSGSGKSSLAFDTIYAEGQRRYMESLSSYARQFLGQMEKPKVDSLEGLPPAISIDQKSTNRNPRSTVGTVTEIYDYFRLLYARCGVVHCPTCGREIKKQTVDQMVDTLMALPERTRLQLLAPVVRGRKGMHEKLLAQARKSGYVRVRIDGSLYELSEEIRLDKNIKHNIEILIDRLIVKPGIEKRLSESLEQVLAQAEGLAYVEVQRPKTEKDIHPDEIGRNGQGETDTSSHKDTEIFTFSENYACPYDGTSIDEIEPRSFSFNNPFGACPECTGLGYKMEFDLDLMIPNPDLSIDDGAIVVPGWQSSRQEGSFTRALLNALAEEYHFSLSTPFKEYPKEIRDVLINGTDYLTTGLMALCSGPIAYILFRKICGGLSVNDPEGNPVNGFGIPKGDTVRIGVFSLCAGAMAFFGQFWLRWYEISWGEWEPDDYDVFCNVIPQVQTGLAIGGAILIVFGLIMYFIGKKKDPPLPEHELDVEATLNKYLMEEKTETFFD